MHLSKLAAALSILSLSLTLHAAPRSAASEVSISEDENSYTLANGIVAARVSKRSGDLTSLKFNGLEMLNADSGRQAAYWSHNAARGEQTARITIKPSDESGELGEVSVKGISGGNQMGSGPGGSVIADVEIRYALRRGDTGVYTYSIFNHPTARRGFA
jgi:rhamnogalacturonan endolyase